MDKINENDFIEIEYTGKLKEDNIVFDTTDKEQAKKAGIFNEKIDYSPAIICVGQGQLVGILDKKLIGKEFNKQYEIELSSNESFGNKDAKLLKLISTSTFKKQNIVPAPGMRVNIDNAYGTIRTVTGGRTFVDFNHPLAGKEVIYTVKVLKKIEDDAEKVKALMKLELRIKPEHVTYKEGKVKVDSKMELPEEFTKMLTERFQSMIPAVKDIKFVSKDKEVQKTDINNKNV